MIDVTLWLDKSGCLCGIDASGHSGSAGAGEDIICAAASTLLRTVSRTLEMEPSIKLEGNVEEKGELHLRLILSDKSESDWLRGVSSFTVTGLKDLESEYPDYCRIRYERADSNCLDYKEINNGT